MTYEPTKQGLLQFAYRDGQGSVDYWGVLTVEFGQEENQWIGLCRELGTATHADSLGEVESELREAIDLQLNEMSRICDVLQYLTENNVRMSQVSIPQEPGFVVTGNVLSA